MGYSIGSAFVVGLEEVEKRQLLPGYKIEWVLRDTWCRSRRGMTMVVDMWNEVEDLDAIIGPGCSSACHPVGLLAAAWGIPVVSPSCAAALLSDKALYPTFSRVSGSASALAHFLDDLATLFNWTRIGIGAEHDFQKTALTTKAIMERNGKIVFYHSIKTTMDGNKINWQNLEKLQDIVKSMKSEAKILYVLTYGSNFRNFLISAYDIGMMNGKYVYIGIDLEYLIKVKFNYRPELDKYIYNGMIRTASRKNAGPEYDAFSQRVIKAFQHPHFEGYSHLPLTANISEINSYAGKYS